MRAYLLDDAAVEPLLAAHLVDLELQNQRPRSIRERRFAVLRAARVLGHPLAGVTPEELAVWQRTTLAHLTSAGMHNETVHVRQYLRWLAANGHRREDPSAVLIRPKMRPHLPRPMGEAQIAQAIDSAPYPGAGVDRPCRVLGAALHGDRRPGA